MPSRRQPSSAVRMQIVAMLTSFFFAFVVLAFRQELSLRFHLREDVVLIVGSGLLFYGFAIGLLLYLRGTIRLPFIESIVLEEPSRAADRQSAVINARFDRLQEHIKELQSHVSAQASRAFSESERNRVVAELKSNLSEALTSQLEQQYRADYQRSAHLAEARSAFAENSQRLINEVAALSRRGNLNLVIGVLTTAAAASLLLYTSVQASHSFSSMTDLLSYYIPRISTVIFIEVFAFFFLRLYKATLNDLQYFQDELTRTAMYEVAVESAMRTQDNSIVGVVLRRITKTSRLPNSPNAETEQKFELNPAVLKQIVELIRTAQPHSG
jgi:hypothetical protein